MLVDQRSILYKYDASGIGIMLYMKP